ncbi:hypothetical protein [Paraflavitalea sp. CAU 1676]|uniref:hypothetical protein n=1 Tax=Paraflavitalea sp. CAU 1676 TaxID=3032598 RepID=UPI0023D99FB5|nr:hypothetical protein [Paraflavitalea sp. CAU 1676]MDF2192166.1 hypothetical protein [Paraflavitalea sp. CAU 1676]
MFLDVYHLNKGIKPIFSDIDSIDWYDGAVNGVFRLDQTNQWFLFCMVYFELNIRERIFFVIETSEEWKVEFTGMFQYHEYGWLTNYDQVKAKMRSAFQNYAGDVYLVKARTLEGNEYEIVQIPLEHLRYVDTIEEGVDQDEAFVSRLNSLFIERPGS